MVPNSLLRLPTFTGILLAATALAPAVGAQNRQIELEWLRNAGLTISGTTPGYGAGMSIASAGDVNGDGYDDIVIGAPNASPGGAIKAGQAWIVFGGEALTGTKSLSDADVVTLTGNPNTPIVGGNAGKSVAGVGDVNGDGFDDVLVGAPNEKPAGTGSGQSYLVYGGPALPPSISLVTLTGTTGVILDGPANSALSGWDVAGPGDVNGDSIPDLAIGAPGAQSFKGETYVVYGSASLPSVVSLGGLTSATGVVLRGGTGDHAGETLAGIGDFNGDGKGDVLVGAPQATLMGKAYVVFGGSAMGALIDLATLGSAGVTFTGQVSDEHLSLATAAAGDVNGDGKADLLLASPAADPAGVIHAGEAYLVFGSSSLTGTLGMASLGAQGVAFPGSVGNLRLANAVGGGGDVNRDGLADFVIAVENASPNGDAGAGQAYLVYGASSGWPASFSLDTLNQRGVVLAGVDVNDKAGDAVMVGGDMNDDGAADLVIGVLGGDGGGADSGEFVLVYGACHFLQAVGPVAEGGSLSLRAHGNASQPMEMIYSPFLLLNGPLMSGLGPFYLGLPFFEAPLGSFGANGEYQVTFPLPGSGLAGLTLHMQFLGKPQGKHCDLTALLTFTFE